MDIITFNANGIRSAARKGFFSWLENQQADLVCIQETKAWELQLTDAIFHPRGYYRYIYDAQKKGYSGTAIYSTQQPNAVHKGLGFDICDDEGRWLQVDFDHLSVVSLYMPSGSSSDEKQQRKFAFMDALTPILKDMQADPAREYIICADWNICHTELDLKNWKSNQKNSGFLPEERQWMDVLLTSGGFTDVFRALHPEKAIYTWWSNRGNAYANNVGWRLDYQLTTSGLRDKATKAWVYTDQKFSDHAPVVISYQMEV